MKNNITYQEMLMFHQILNSFPAIGISYMAFSEQHKGVTCPDSLLSYLSGNKPQYGKYYRILKTLKEEHREQYKEILDKLYLDGDPKQRILDEYAELKADDIALFYVD